MCTSFLARRWLFWAVLAGALDRASRSRQTPLPPTAAPTTPAAPAACPSIDLSRTFRHNPRPPSTSGIRDHCKSQLGVTEAQMPLLGCLSRRAMRDKRGGHGCALHAGAPSAG